MSSVYDLALKVIFPTGCNYSEETIFDALATAMYQLCDEVTVSIVCDEG